MIAFSHPTGNQNSRHAAFALAEAGLLAEMWTSIRWKEDGLLDRLLPAGGRAELRRRSFPKELHPWIRTMPWCELGRLVSIRLGLHSLVLGERARFSIDSVFAAMDRHMAQNVLSRLHPAGVYAYEDGAVQTFRRARELGIRRIYELPIGYWGAAHAILREECEREPEWAVTLGGLTDSEEKLMRKDEEARLATTIIVPSTFVRDTLKLGPDVEAPVHVVPYGAPPVREDLPKKKSGGPLRVLFVGSLGQRKGLTYLLEAIELLGGGATLTLLGRKTSEACKSLNGAVKRHRWVPSLPHTEVLREMSRHDVLIFPSLFEGFGLVILEAMAQGLPVVATPHTAAPDIVEDGQDGFIVPIRDSRAIAKALEQLIREPECLLAMKWAAMRKAAHFSWKNYRVRLAQLVRQILRERQQVYS